MEPNIEPIISKENPPEEVSLRFKEEEMQAYIRREMLALAPKAMELIKKALESRNQAKARRVAAVVLEQVGKMGEGETSREAKRVLKAWRSRRRRKPTPTAPEVTPAPGEGTE